MTNRTFAAAGRSERASGYLLPLRETGLRGGDAVRVGRPHLRDGVIRLATEKTGKRVAVAVPGALAEALAAGPTGN
jgi:hypothetical protein